MWTSEIRMEIPGLPLSQCCCEMQNQPEILHMKAFLKLTSFFFNCINVSLTSSFCSKIPPNISHYLYLCCLMLFLIMTVSQTFLVFDDLESMRHAFRHDFVACSSVGICLMFVSDVNRVCGFWEEDHRGERALLTQSCQGYMPSVWLITVDADLDHLAKVVDCLHGSLLFSFSLSVLSSLEESHYMQPTLKK